MYRIFVQSIKAKLEKFQKLRTKIQGMSTVYLELTAGANGKKQKL